MIHHTPVTNSEAVSGIWYNDEDATIVVQLVNGKRYTFWAQSRTDYDAFVAAESKGRHFNKLVKEAREWNKTRSA